MSRAVALSRLQELGIRGRDDPPAEPAQWAGMEVGDGGLRALHEALHPSLLLLTLAGYHIDQVVLGRPGDGDVLLVDLSPRAATVLPWGEYLETGGEEEWPFSAPFTVLMWLKLRHGLIGDPVDVPSQTMIAGFPFVALDVDAPADLGAIASRLPAAQEPLRDELVAWIVQAWWNTDWSVATTGLLAALEPDLWTFPGLDDDQELQRLAFRRLGEVIANPTLATEPALSAFLIEEAAVRENGRPPSVRARLTAAVPDEVADLEQAWNTEAAALWAELHPDGGTDPFRRADHRRLSYCELVFDMLNESLITLAGYTPQLEESAYGGYDLRRGDRDPREDDLEWIYGGRTITAEGDAPRPDHVDQLRRDLAQIGFGPLADGDMAPDPAIDDEDEPPDATQRRTFGAYLESAVREFQIYASMRTVARVALPEELPEVRYPSLATSLVGQPNDQRYMGPISGVVNGETRILLKMWVDRDWHCPVVIEARRVYDDDVDDDELEAELLTEQELLELRDPMSTADKAQLVTDAQIEAGHHNIWRRTELENKRYAFIAWDFTRHYPAPVVRPWGDPVVVARWGNVGSWGGAYGEAPWYTWPEAELTPVNLFGADLDPEQRPQQGAFWSTYRVIRAVSEVECQGVLDGMNAWDSAIVSGGPVHFTLGLCRKSGGGTLHTAPRPCVVYPGELCPVLSLLADEDEAEYERFFGAFGLQPRETWRDPPTEMFSSGHRKYRGFVLLQDESGEFVDARTVRPDTVRRVPADLDANHEDYLLVEVLHHWHWIYRWQMAPRLSPAFREATYRLARARLRALLSTPWGTLGGAPDGLTLGQVFTSEKAVALLERLHVFSPPTLLKVENIEAEWEGQTVHNIDFTPILGAFERARDTEGGGSNPADWDDPQEAAAVEWLRTCGLKGSGPDDDLTTLVEWPKLGTYENRRHDLSLLEVAMEEAPDISHLAPMTVAPGTEAQARFLVSDRETEDGGSTVYVTVDDDDTLVASLEDIGDGFYDLVLRPPEGADGEVRVTVTARDRRHKTTREVMVNVTADGSMPEGQAAAYVRPAPIGLSAQRGSFQIDDGDLFVQPADPPPPEPI